jgi:hypothetical protein
LNKRNKENNASKNERKKQRRVYMIKRIKQKRALITRAIGVREYNRKFPDWPPGARTANATALCQ